MEVAWQCISKRLWKCLVGRYGDCFEERYKEVYDDRAYHAKGLDVLVQVDANSRNEKEAMHDTGEARKIWEGGSVNFRILTLVRRTHAIIIGNSQSNNEVSQRDKYPEEECMGVWLSLRILDSWYVSVL